jgi:two-component system sensor histidine kinase QseC
MNPWRAPRSLQTRLLVMVLGLAMLVWLGAALITWIDARHELDELLDGHLTQAASMLVMQADGDDDDIGDAPVLHKYAPQVAFQVFISGQLITRSSNTATTPMSTQEEGFSTVVLPDGQPWRVFATYVPARNVQVFVAEKIELRQAILWAVMRSMLWPLAIALPLLAFVGWWSVRKGLEPVRQLSSQLARRPAQALQPVGAGAMPIELVPLVDALNALLNRIGGMVESERRFTADAAHELRTPIAAIRAQAQVALGSGDDSQQRTHALQATLAGCDRATRLVEQLLMLARLEAGPASGATPVDLSSLARRVASDLAPGALARGQVLELDAPAACLVSGSEALLSVLVRNLADNALRYSPDGAGIQIAVRKEDDPDGGKVCLCVQDSGPGMTPEAMARLGERFFRVLGSDQPGSGLGWSIVRRLVDVFGATVQVGRSDALGGLSVTVSWPA